ncbi:MAG: triose-phosphate isomerase [Omnitrophica WOR_2 bacterium RIFCSPHIGHO2_02_FULL_45_21]|nr:MAG: triose-phosphate isomerase [Omnitrophica WOR_2 bacterium RIFCSPHIGHO2_02_FULL_45_21]
MRKPIIAGNWKMHKTIEEGEKLVNLLKRQLYDLEDIDIVLCPPFTHLAYIADMLESSNILLGAQDMHWEDEGAYTGEISAPMLKSAGCKFVLIGHSERRQLFGETNETVHKKLTSALNNGLTPIVCIGENLKQREEGVTFALVSEQLELALKALQPERLKEIIIAYEPVWAIGSGKVASSEQAQEVHRYIRDWLSKNYGLSLAQEVRIQYGGSVKPDNIAGLIAQADVDGALVGGSSLDADSFCAIVKIVRDPTS